MKITGTLHKMLTEYQNPVRYYLNFQQGFVDVNQSIGKKIRIEHIANECNSCGLDKPIFRMGFCKNCFYTAPQASPSIINPELSKAHLGIADRDLAFEKSFQLQPHVVYLALSGGLKVGVTRQKQVPTRWVDQGATNAIILAETENRYQAGEIEVLLKGFLADKTNWQRMLKNQNPEVNLLKKKQKLKEKLTLEQVTMFSENDKIWEFVYPVEDYPEKVKSVNLSKVKSFEGVLKGVKGQYFIFEDNSVFNVRNHEGYVVDLDVV